MLTRILSISCFLFVIGAGPLSAQPFFGYQSIGIHTGFISLSYDGETSEVGVGYALRRPWGGFTDITLEWKAPLADVWGPKQTVIAGAYGPFRLRNRPFLGGGLHTRIHLQGTETKIQLAGTLIPSYTFAAPLGDQPYITGGIRATGLLDIVKTSSGAGETKWFSGAGVELGGRLDAIFERTLGLATNVYAKREWGESSNTNWNVKGDTYVGSAYYLLRW